MVIDFGTKCFRTSATITILTIKFQSEVSDETSSAEKLKCILSVSDFAFVGLLICEIMRIYLYLFY